MDGQAQMLTIDRIINGSHLHRQNRRYPTSSTVTNDGTITFGTNRFGYIHTSFWSSRSRHHYRERGGQTCISMSNVCTPLPTHPPYDFCFGSILHRHEHRCVTIMVIHHGRLMTPRGRPKSIYTDADQRTNAYGRAGVTIGPWATQRNYTCATR